MQEAPKFSSANSPEGVIATRWSLPFASGRGRATRYGRGVVGRAANGRADNCAGASGVSVSSPSPSASISRDVAVSGTQRRCFLISVRSTAKTPRRQVVRRHQGSPGEDDHRSREGVEFIVGLVHGGSSLASWRLGGSSCRGHDADRSAVVRPMSTPGWGHASFFTAPPQDPSAARSTAASCVSSEHASRFVPSQA